MKLFHTSLLLLATSVLSIFALTTNVGNSIKAVPSGKSLNTTQVIPSNSTTAIEHPKTLTNGSLPTTELGPIITDIDETIAEEDCNDQTEDSYETAMKSGAGQGDEEDPSVGEIPKSVSAAVPATSLYTAIGSQTPSIRPTSASNFSGRPISIVLTTVTLLPSVYPPIASSANITDGRTSDAPSSSAQKISTILAAVVAVMMIAN